MATWSHSQADLISHKTTLSRAGVFTLAALCVRSWSLPDPSYVRVHVCAFDSVLKTCVYVCASRRECVEVKGKFA